MDVSVVSIICSAAVSVVSVCVPIVIEYFRSKNTLRLKRLEIYSERSIDNYMKFCSAYSKMDFKDNRDSVTEYLSASRSVAIMSDDKMNAIFWHIVENCGNEYLSISRISGINKQKYRRKKS